MAAHGDRYQGMGQKLATSLHGISKKETLRFVKGEAVRGFKSILSVKEETFLNVGELYLFGSILAKIFEDRSVFNSFHELEIKSVNSGMVLTFPSPAGGEGVAKRRMRGN
jgi:type VI secretion system protein ImpG